MLLGGGVLFLLMTRNSYDVDQLVAGLLATLIGGFGLIVTLAVIYLKN